jgi:hypothetical protein
MFLPACRKGMAGNTVAELGHWVINGLNQVLAQHGPCKCLRGHTGTLLQPRVARNRDRGKGRWDDWECMTYSMEGGQQGFRLFPEYGNNVDDKGNPDPMFSYLRVKPPFGTGRWLEGAHRLVLWALQGPPPHVKDIALHLCNNKACLCPAHLMWGSAAENKKYGNPRFEGTTQELCARKAALWEGQWPEPKAVVWKWNGEPVA